MCDLLFIESSAQMVVFCLVAVFVALVSLGILTSWLKGLLADKNSVSTEVGRVSTANPADLNMSNIVAVVAAIHKFKMEKMDEHNILLTYRRANINMWHASGKVDLPTIKYNTMRRR